MKKIILISAAVLAYASIHAQLTNTRWKGLLKGDNPRNAILDFRKDAFNVYTVADSEMVERMTYTISDNTITLKKIDGQSDCDNTVPGKYKFEMKEGKLNIKLAADECSDRSSAFDATVWMKWKDHPEVNVAKSILKQYVGVYELDAAHHIYVTFENGRLYIEGPDNKLPKVPLISESNTKFFVKIAGVEMDFVKDANGKVVEFISHEEKDYSLKKIK